MIEEAVESLRRPAEEKGVHLALDVEPDPVPVRGDRLRLYQVIVKLRHARRRTGGGLSRTRHQADRS